MRCLGAIVNPGALCPGRAGTRGIHVRARPLPLRNAIGKGRAMPQSRIRRYVRHGTLPQLAVFEASARLSSFTRAADELHLAQPTVSAQIKKLSETFGVPLFEQVGRKIRLTEPGRC